MNRPMKGGILLFLAVSLTLGAQPLHITHEFANKNARSVIGLPSGSRKTMVEMDGTLRWSQWSLKRKPLDTPFGFSGQLDGALGIRNFKIAGQAESPLRAGKQSLYKGRFPFIVTQFGAGDLEFEELAFPAESGGQGLDVVRLRCTNRSAESAAPNASR